MCLCALYSRGNRQALEYNKQLWRFYLVVSLCRAAALLISSEEEEKREEDIAVAKVRGLSRVCVRFVNGTGWTQCRERD